MKRAAVIVCALIVCMSCAILGACSKVDNSMIIEKCYTWSIYFSVNKKPDKITVRRSVVCEQEDEKEREIYVCVFQSDEVIEVFHGYTLDKQVYLFYHNAHDLQAYYNKDLN